MYIKFIIIIIITLVLIYLIYGNRNELFNNNEFSSTSFIMNYSQFKKWYNNQQFDSNKIPKILYKTSFQSKEELPIEIINIMYDTFKNNPEFIQVYFSDEDCLQFITEYYPEYLHAYDIIIPGAFKADLFRILLLYKYGGIYNDLSHMYLIKIKDIIDFDKQELVLVRDYPVFDDNENNMHGLYNAFIASNPRNEYIYNVIQQTVQNIETRNYGIHCHDITGPLVFTRIFNRMSKRSEESIIERGEYNNGKILVLYNTYHYIIDKNNLNIIKLKIDNHYDILYKKRNIKHYYDLWNDHNVFKIEN